MIKSILLPVDGSEYTDTVLKYGIYLAQQLDARIMVLSVVDIRIFEWALSMGSDGFVPIVPSGAYHDESRKLLEKRAQAILKKSSKMLETNNISHEVEMVSGSPIEIISEQAHLADLLIMGNRGEYARWKSTTIGATLEAVTRQINKPILITPKEYRDFKKIQVAYDGSDNANRALQLAGYLGSQLNIEVLIITISDNEQLGQNICDEAVKYLESYDVKLKTAVLKGDVESVILSTAHENEADVILMGAFGHSRIREAILGSTTSHIMRKSDIPVLLSK